MTHPARHRHEQARRSISAPTASPQRRDPWSFRRHGSGTRCSRRVSLPRVPNSAFPSLHRVLGTRVPRLPRYYERLRLPNARPAALRCLRLAVPAVTPVFELRTVRRRDHAAWGTLGLADPGQLCSRRRGDLPGSWRTLLCLCPGLRPRQDHPLKPFEVPVLPPLRQRRRLPQGDNFRGSIPRLRH